MPVGVKEMCPVLICLCWDASWDEREEAAAAAASPAEPGPVGVGAAGSAAACY